MTTYRISYFTTKRDDPVDPGAQVVDCGSLGVRVVRTFEADNEEEAVKVARITVFPVGSFFHNLEPVVTRDCAAMDE